MRTHGERNPLEPPSGLLPEEVLRVVRAEINLTASPALVANQVELLGDAVVTLPDGRWWLRHEPATATDPVPAARGARDGAPTKLVALDGDPASDPKGFRPPVGAVAQAAT